MQKNLLILSADDDSDDQDFIEEALRQVHENAFELRRVPDGEALLSTLKQMEDQGDKLPDLILLDLNMPVKNGKEAIRDLKARRSAFRKIPVVVLTTSNASEDVNYCINNGADSFLVKPNSLTDLSYMLETALKKYIDNFS